MQPINNQNSHYQKVKILSRNENSVSDGKLSEQVSTESIEMFNTYNSQEQRQTLKQIFDLYLKEKRLTGDPFPIKINNHGYVLDRDQVCKEIYEKFGICFRFDNFRKRSWLGEEIGQRCSAQLKKDGLIKPTYEEKRQARAAEQKRQQEYASTLENWLGKLRESGRKLKFNNLRNGGGIDNLWVSQQTSIPYSHLTNSATLCCKKLAKAKKEIGVERYLITKEFAYKEYTYQALLDYGTNCRRSEVEDNKTAGSQVNNTRSALLIFIKNRDLTLNSIVGAEFGILFNESLHGAVLGIDNSQTKKQFVYEARRWQKYYGELRQADELPPDLPSALRFLLEKSGTSRIELEKLNTTKNLRGKTIGNWVKGNTHPTLKSIPLIHNIEDYFYLPRNTLVSRTIFNPRTGNEAALRKGDFPKLSAKEVKLISKWLPTNFSSLPVVEQKLFVKTARDTIAVNTNEYRRRLVMAIKEPYRLQWKNFPPELIDEITKLTEFKTSDFTPIGYKRGELDGWKNDPEDRGTASIFKRDVKTLFGVLTSSKEKSGAGLKPEQLTLALFALPITWKIYQAFMKKRCSRFPVACAVRYAATFSSLINPEHGWITQSPWLSERLQPIPGFLTEQEVAQAKEDWAGFLRKSTVDLTIIFNDFKRLNKKTSPSRDSHLPILPILESDKPLKIIRDAIAEYQKKIPSHRVKPVENAAKLRNTVFLRILSETALRSHNMVNMTWKENNTGHLRRHQNGYYHLEIPHTEFKNPQSSFFGPPGRERPFKVELSGVVTSLLDEYLFRCRPYLIEKWMMSKNSEGGVEDEGFLFISSSCGKSQRISYSSAAVIVVDFSIEHLVYNPLTETGLKGVESFAPHSFRHIFATHVLKDTGSFANAGAAIQDSEATARRYYAQYQPSDRDKQYRQTIKDLMEEENE